MNDLHALTENLAALLRREHDALADFLVALADFDRKRLWAGLGYGSLFYFLHRELRLSKGAAQYRKVAAELIQEVPAVVEPLRQGKLCLTSIIEAAKVVTAENWETVLPRFYGLSKREAMEVVAELQPQAAPPVRTVLTSARPSACHTASVPPESVRLASEPAPALRPTAPSPRPTEHLPLSSELSRLHVTVSKRFARKLGSSGICGCTRRLQLDHVVPLARGGTSTADNVRILCASHNLEAARLALGDEWMDRYAPRRAAPCPPAIPREPSRSERPAPPG